MINSKFIHYDRPNRLQFEIGDLFDNDYIGLPNYFFEFLSWNRHLIWLKSYLYDIEQRPISDIKLRLEELENSIFGDIIRCKLYTDLIFEQVRRELYIDKPSRIYSIFFTDDLVKNKWEKQLLKFHESDSIQYVFEVIEVVRFHKTYSFYFEQQITLDRYNEIADNARLYWEGVVPYNKPDALPEILFIGKAQVVDKVLIEPNQASSISADFSGYTKK
jgi:hypothetical protein